MGTGENAMGLPGGDAGQPCPFDADAEAIAFVRQYRPAIDWAINSLFVPERDRNDILQEMVIRMLLCFRKRGPLGEGSHLSFAITVAKRVALDHLQGYRRSLRRSTAIPPDLEARLADTSAGPEDLLVRKEGHQRLHLAIASLSPLKRHVVRRVMAGASMVEVAAEMGREHNSVKVIHHRAVQELKARLVSR